MRYMSEGAVNKFNALHWLMFKLKIVESQYYNSSLVVMYLSKLEDKCIMDYIEQDE